MRLFSKIDECLERAELKTTYSFFDKSFSFYMAYGMPSFDPYKECNRGAGRNLKIERELSIYHALHTPLTAPIVATAYTMKLFIETLEAIIRLPYDYFMNNPADKSSRNEFTTDKHYAIFGFVMVLISALVAALSLLMMLISLAVHGAASVKALFCQRHGDLEADSQPEVTGSP